MASARGDRKPCTHGECSGTMQFGRQPQLQVSSAIPQGEHGWACSENESHFQLAWEDPRLDTAARAAPQARWDDDGGSTSGKNPTGSRRR
jgi:hypothetical protein